MEQVSKAVRKIYAFANTLINAGVEKNATLYESKYVKFTNVVALLTFISVLLYVPNSLLRGYYYLSLLQTLDALCVLLVLYLNHQKLHTASRFLYLAVINVFVLINSCLIGHESKVYEFYYVCYIVPFLLFSVREYKNIIAGVVLSLACFYLYFEVYPYFSSYNLDPVTQTTIYQINMLMKFVLFGTAVFILANYNFLTEKKLAESNARLVEQADELKRSNKDLEHFAYIISHDLKAPVRQITSFMKLLQDKYSAGLGKDGSELVGMSRESSLRLALLIDDMLSYSRVGRNLSEPQEVNTNEMLAMLQNEMREVLTERKATVVAANELPILNEVHSSMVYHIFQNLISNGIKFNNNPYPQITVSCKPEGNMYRFAISDNGIGINAQHAGKLFQMFQRLHLASEYDGSGMGLAICKKVVEFYGGKIWFESEPGQGTTFIFSLPMGVAQGKVRPLPGNQESKNLLSRYAAAF
jgi:signal transduction histidine kinase